MRTYLTICGTSALHKLDQLESDPKGASAELNVLEREELGKQDKVILFHTDTPDGRTCAQALRAYLGKRCVAQTEEIPNLSSPESFQKGLRNLAQSLIGAVEVERRAGNQVIMNATGGFKPMVVVATVVALLHNLPALYIHETFREQVAFPALPIGFDWDLFHDTRDFMDWVCDEVPPFEDARARINEYPPVVRSQLNSLLAPEDGFCNLSPLGFAFYQAFEMSHQPDPTCLVELGRKAGQKMSEWSKRDVKLYRRFKRQLRYLQNSAVRHRARKKTLPGCYGYGQYEGTRILLVDTDQGFRVLDLFPEHNAEYDAALKSGATSEDICGPYEPFTLE